MVTQLVYFGSNGIYHGSMIKATVLMAVRGYFHEDVFQVSIS